MGGTRWAALAAAAASVLGMTPAPGAAAARSLPDVADAAVVCSGPIALGAAEACTVPVGGGSARYRFSVPAADTIRLRAATPPHGGADVIVYLLTGDGTEICENSTGGTFDCAAPAAGSYAVRVVVSQAVTVYTTVDAVLAVPCSGTLALGVGDPGTDVDIADPGGSWCAPLTDAPPGAVLAMALDTNGDEALFVSVYDASGHLLCGDEEVTASARTDCSFGPGGAGYRLFATPGVDGAQDAVLVVTRVSHPSGCGTRAPDPFGVSASRRVTLPPHQLTCYRFAAAAGAAVGVDVFNPPGRTFGWTVRDDSGHAVCTGTAGDAHWLSACTVPAAGRYALFVSSLADESARALVALVDLASDAGCADVSSTAWDAGPSGGDLAEPGEVDCWTFDAVKGDRVRSAVFGPVDRSGSIVHGLVTTSSGAEVCDFSFTTNCAVPRTGTYRAVLSSSRITPAAYRMWNIDMNTTAGCTATTTDTFGTAPSRTASFDGDRLAVCYSFVAPAGAAIYPTSEALDTGFFASAEIRSPDGGPSCDQVVCAITSAGTHLLVLTSASGGDPTHTPAAVAVGLWRADQPVGCTTIGTSFDGPAVSGELDAAAQADCHTFTGATGGSVLVDTDPPDYSATSVIFSNDGRLDCFAVVNTCRLFGPGPYRLVTTAGSHAPRPYAVRVASLSHATGCEQLPVSRFGAAPTRAFAVGGALDLRCYRTTIPGADTGEIAVRSTGVDPSVRPVVQVYGPGHTLGCEIAADFGRCPAVTSGQYLFVVSGAEPANGRIGWYDLTAGPGCASGPNLAFGTSATPARIRVRGTVDCLIVPTHARDHVRFSFGPVTSGAVVHASLLDRLGEDSCGFSSTDSFTADCTIGFDQPDGARLVSWADEDGATVSGVRFALHGWRLNDPVGCTGAGSLRHALGPLVGTLADRNDEACYRVRAGPGTESVTTSNDDVPADVPLVQFVRSSGVPSCSVQGSGSCALTNDTYALLVRRGERVQDAGFTGTYRVSGSCASGTCGPADAASKAVACKTSIDLGGTKVCDLPGGGGGTARYSFTVPAADTIRVRAAAPGADFFHTVTLSTADGTPICSQSTIDGIECAVPSAGDYRVDVTYAIAARVYTSVDAVLADPCDAPLDLTVGAPGADVDIAQPGGSWCAALGDAPAGSVLDLALDANGYEALDVSVYDSAGAQLCSADVVTRARFECRFTGGGAGYRLFATPAGDTAQDALLIVSRASDPSGCRSRPPDAFGVAASRGGNLAPHQQQCYVVAGQQGHGIGIHLFGAAYPQLTWTLRTAAGDQVCTGAAGGIFYPLMACTLPSDGEYAVFVSSVSAQTVRFVLSLVDLSSDAGCTAADSTAWDAEPWASTLAGPGQVDCRTFTASAGDPIRVATFDANVRGLLTTADGAVVCTFNSLATDCTVPATGSYRGVLSAVVRTSVPYRLWTIDTASTAGCAPTTPDVFGSGPTRTAYLGTDDLQVCYTFDARAASAYYRTTDTLTGGAYATSEVRTTDGAGCRLEMCPVTDAGTHLLVVSRGGYTDPALAQGTIRVGLFRGDGRAPGCTPIGTSFTSAPASGSLDAPAQADCHAFAGETGGLVLARSTALSHVYDRDGRPVCSFGLESACTLNGTGPFHVVTATEGQPTPVPYRLRIASVARHRGCADLAATQFGQAPSRSFTIADALDLHCYAITVPAGTRVIGVRTVGVSHPYPFAATIYRARGTVSCSVRDEFVECPTPTGGTYLLVVSDQSPETGRLGWYDMAASAGCTPGPSLAFGEPAAPGRIQGRGAVACLTVPLTANDQPRFAFGPSASGVNLVGWLLRSDGTNGCWLESVAPVPDNCAAVPASEPDGTRVVVWAGDTQSTRTGRFSLHAWRLDDPVGCTDAGSLHTPLGPLVGTLADRNDEACYRVAAGQGVESITSSNDDVPVDVPRVQLLKANGAQTCSVQGSGSCSLSNATSSLLVLRGERPQDVDFAGTYRIEGTCTSGACGP